MPPTHPPKQYPQKKFRGFFGNSGLVSKVQTKTAQIQKSRKNFPSLGGVIY